MSDQTIAPGGQVTIADLFRVMSGIQADLGRALTKLEVIDNRNMTVDSTTADHEARIRVLERFRYAVMGASVVVSGAAGALGWLLGSGIHH